MTQRRSGGGTDVDELLEQRRGEVEPLMAVAHAGLPVVPWRT
jgi:hypothetical protein